VGTSTASTAASATAAATHTDAGAAPYVCATGAATHHTAATESGQS